MLRKWWPLLVLLAFQVGTLVYISRGAASAGSSGLQIRLRTEAYDPFDTLAGRYVRLTYAVEGPPSDEAAELEDGAEVWITIERGEPAWGRSKIGRTRVPFSDNELSLRAELRGGRARILNAGRLYMQEELCLEADELLREDPSGGFVTLGVDREGNATPLFLELRGRIFSGNR